VQRGTYFIRDTKIACDKGELLLVFLGNKPKSGDVVSHGISGTEHKSIGLGRIYPRIWNLYVAARSTLSAYYN